jgi:hypothetical protein
VYGRNYFIYRPIVDQDPALGHSDFSYEDDPGNCGYLYLRVRSREGQVLSFQVIANQPDGNCMFRALSQAMCDSEALHDKIRRDIVLYVTTELNWKVYYPYIRVQHEDLDLEADTSNSNCNANSKSKLPVKKDNDSPSVTPNNNEGKNSPLAPLAEEELWRENYRKYMSQDGVYGTLQELQAASDLLKFNLIIVREVTDGIFSIQTFKEHTWADSHFFLFTGSAEDGHFELIVPDSL